MDLATLPQLSSNELRQAWPQWFDQPLPRQASRDLLLRALAYRIQERTSGGLSATTRKRLHAMAATMRQCRGRDRSRAPHLTPGTRLMRQWRDQVHDVIVEDAGFAYRGVRYRSLSEIARIITGTRWSGPAFFGIKTATSKKGGARRGS